jgi:hypothetical protein
MRYAVVALPLLRIAQEEIIVNWAVNPFAITADFPFS